MATFCLILPHFDRLSGMRIFALMVGVLVGLSAPLYATNEAPVILSLVMRDAAHPEVLTIRLENRSGHDIYWLDWWMPDGGKVRNKLLEIKTTAGQEADYIGIFASYGDPVRRDYVLLKHGTSVEETVDLTQSYLLRRDTDYEAVIDRILEYYDTADAAAPGKWATLKSNRLKIRLKSSLWQKMLNLWSKGP